MKLKLIRRLFIIRLAVSFILDYWKIVYLNKKLKGTELDIKVNRICTKAGKRMRLTAFRLKGILVKIGQFLSMREDLLPRAFTEELSALQDAMPEAPFDAVLPVLEQELQGKLHTVFRSFNEKTLAAASLAQVHKAVLLDGTEVAVKVLRPSMEQLAQADLDSLGLAAKIAQHIPFLSRKMNFVELHQEFTETIQREMDFCQELSHLERFNKIFTDNQHIKLPKAYREYTTHRLLVMEYIEGARVTDQRKLSAWNVNGLSLAEHLLEAYLRQLFIHGFIHVDPHPGNLFVLPDHRLCLIDFGMIDELTKTEIKTLRLLLQSILFHDLEGIMDSLDHLGFLKPHANRENLKSLINHVLSDGQGITADKLRLIMKNSPLKLRAKYMFLIRGTGLLLSTLSILAPDAERLDLFLKAAPSVFMEPVKEKSKTP